MNIKVAVLIQQVVSCCFPGYTVLLGLAERTGQLSAGGAASPHTLSTSLARCLHSRSVVLAHLLVDHLQ